MPHRYVVLVPIKSAHRAKTRLDAGELRGIAMKAFAKDAIAAAMASARVAGVLVVSEEPAELGQSGWLPDAGGGLNAALSVAAARVSQSHPDHGIVAMLGDLPCLSTNHLDTILAFGQEHERWFVADHHQSGTTILGAAPGQVLAPHFGTNSASRHAASGATACELEVASARIDIDTIEDPRLAQLFGVGAHTEKALRAGDFRQPTLKE